MMKKTFKQLLGLTLSVAMVISMAGCGNEATKNTETQAVSKETETTQAKETETQVVEEELTYPLDSDEKITLWTHRLTLNGEYTSYTESPFHTGLAKQTGVDIEFLFPNKGQSYVEGFNLLLTQKVLPDVIFKATNNTELSELCRDGVIYDLTPYLEEYAPDYWAYINAPENEDIYRAVVTEDGKVLAFYGFRESDFGITYSGPMIRQDWLDECGLPTPVTLEDWENVLTVFKEKYNATLGIASGSFKGVFFASGTGAMSTGANGYPTTFYRDDNGKLQFAQLQPEWVEYIKILNRWYETGLIDNDSVTMDAAAVRTKAVNNQIGASIGAMSQLTNFTVDAEAAGSDAKWVGVSYPRTAPGEPTSMIQYGTRNIGSGAFVTTSCPEDKLITVLKVLNYGYTEEGMRFYNFGEEGLSYTLNAAGEPEWTDVILNDAQGISNAINKYTGATSAPIGVQLDRFVQLKNNPLATDAVFTWIDNTKVADHYLPNMELTEDEKLAFVDKYNAIQTYIQEMTQKFIMGDESLDNIDAFYKRLDEMELQDCIKIYNAAYERWLAK